MEPAFASTILPSLRYISPFSLPFFRNSVHVFLLTESTCRTSVRVISRSEPVCSSSGWYSSEWSIKSGSRFSSDYTPFTIGCQSSYLYRHHYVYLLCKDGCI